MSYSFSVSAKTKDEAKAEVAKQFDTVVQQQPSHSIDRDAANDAVDAFIDLANDPVGEQQLHITVFGSVSSRPSGNEGTSDVIVGGVSMNVSVSVA